LCSQAESRLHAAEARHQAAEAERLLPGSSSARAPLALQPIAEQRVALSQEQASLKDLTSLVDAGHDKENPLWHAPPMAGKQLPALCKDGHEPLISEAWRELIPPAEADCDLAGEPADGCAQQ
jgi:hypothetical protein